MRTAWLPALGLFVLAPVCAEYLWGYDNSTGHPATLVGNLIVFSPLYGAPALLIREAARRFGLGWPGLLLMAAGTYSNVIRVLVPLTIGDAELAEALGVWELALERVLS